MRGLTIKSRRIMKRRIVNWGRRVENIIKFKDIKNKIVNCRSGRVKAIIRAKEKNYISIKTIIELKRRGERRV